MKKGSPPVVAQVLSSFIAASQHGPRPLPLFLDILRDQTAGSPERSAAALAGLRAYQDAGRAKPRKAMPARFRKGQARLRDYGAKGATGRAVIVIPSLINPPHILDLRPESSLLRWLAGQGHRPFLLDWGTQGPKARDLDVDAHITRVLLPLIAKFPVPPILIGYCLGGTMALAASCLTEVAGLALIASPWHFTGYGSAARAEIAALWDSAKPACDTLGLVPMEVLQAGFWRLDPARTIAKYEAFAALEPDSEAARSFIALEDWANGGAPLPFATGVQIFENFIAADTPGTGAWQISGVTIAPAALSCPAIEFVSLNDRIVPAASAANLRDRRDLGAGHVGMIVGRGARTQLWEPLSDWLKALPLPK
ncbi:MAG: alpha/beta fold hydrolase [Pseudomonadota bacterium]|uniref:alpha/beta fold hydrolase n=1 Tax=unclassified Sphingomonas TaxID=196159 RepID=UPI0010F86752